MLVYNAAYQSLPLHPPNFTEIPVSSFEKSLAVSSVGAFHCAQQVINTPELLFKLSSSSLLSEYYSGLVHKAPYGSDVDNLIRTHGYHPYKTLPIWIIDPLLPPLFVFSL